MAFNKNTFFTLFTAVLLSSCNILIPDGKDITEPNFAPGYTEPAISISDTSAIESSDLTFTVALSKTYSSAITVDYTTSNGSATAGSDYSATSGTLTIAKGLTSATITVPVTDDTNDESNETLTMTLSNASKGTFETSSATGTIIDDDGEPTISINDVSASENAGQATFTVSLSNPSSSTVTVDYSTSDGTATTADSDYTATSGTLTFNPGDTTKTFNVTITNDAKNEADETYTATISNPTNATIFDATGTGTITNDDAAPSLAVNDVSVAENVAGGVATFTVTLSAASGQTVTVDYATSDGTATTADSDYTATSGTLTFNPGDTTKTFNVTITNDAKNEASETYTVTISNPSNATISDATGTGTITNDDAVPSLAVNDVTVDEDAGTATFTVTQSAVSGQTVTVDYATSNGTATAGSDYTAASGTLTFNPGDTTKTFNVTITNDTSDEADETYTVTISNPTNATISDATSIGTITDNDVTVDQTDDDNTATGFGGGSHTGTAYTSGVLTLNSTTNYSELDESWTPQWDNLKVYLKLENNYVEEILGLASSTTGSPSFIGDSKLGDYALRFDASEYVQVNNGFSSISSYPVTVSFWARIPSWSDSGFSNQKGLISTGNAAIGSSSNLWFYQREGALGIRYQRGPYDLIHAQVNEITGKWIHIVGVLTASDIKLYINGNLASSNSHAKSFTPFSSANMWLGRVGNSYYDGTQADVDEVALWNAELSTDEIELVYSRQSAKYAGEMKSRVMDSENSDSSWTNLDWLTTLPFGKELPDGGGSANSESSADYSGLYSDSLMDSLVGLWHLNEASGTSGASSVADSSGSSNHGTPSGGITFGPISKLGSGVKLNGSNGRLTMPLVTNKTTDVTLSAWFQTSNFRQDGQMIVYNGSDANANGYGVAVNKETETTGQLRILYGGVFWYATGVFISDTNWHHITLVIRSDGIPLLYLDGTLIFTGIFKARNIPTTMTAIGWNNYPHTRHFNGYIDEVAIWNRTLSADEILQLYRRGANRIKYQVRSCSSADCSDQDALTGDGWKGPGGNYLTYFSELYNNSSVSSSCAIPQACAASELSLDGDVQTSSPSLRFDDFGADGIYMNNNRYFQYRVIMESDDENTACNGGTSTCHPELKSVEIGPAHTYAQ